MLIAVALLCIACTFSIAKIIMLLTANDDETNEVDVWLEEQDLKQYQPHFKEKGKQEGHTKLVFVIFRIMYN